MGRITMYFENPDDGAIPVKAIGELNDFWRKKGAMTQEEWNHRGVKDPLMSHEEKINKFRSKQNLNDYVFSITGSHLGIDPDLPISEHKKQAIEECAKVV